MQTDKKRKQKQHYQQVHLSVLIDKTKTNSCGQWLVLGQSGWPQDSGLDNFQWHLLRLHRYGLQQTYTPWLDERINSHLMLVQIKIMKQIISEGQDNYRDNGTHIHSGALSCPLHLLLCSGISYPLFTLCFITTHFKNTCELTIVSWLYMSKDI